MQIEAKVGPQVVGDGSVTLPRLTKDGTASVADAHGRYQEAVYRGNVFIGANLGGTPVTTQAGLSATTPALTLYNPANSGKLGVLISVTVDITSSPAAAAGLMLAVNAPTAAAPTATTLATQQNAYTSNLSTPSLSCYRIATLAAAPVAIRFIGGTTGAAAIGGVQLVDHVDGEIIVGPGVALSIQSTSAAAILTSFAWEEIPA